MVQLGQHKRGLLMKGKEATLRRESMHIVNAEIFIRDTKLHRSRSRERKDHR